MVTGDVAGISNSVRNGTWEKTCVVHNLDKEKLMVPGISKTSKSVQAEFARRDKISSLRMDQELIETALESITKDNPYRAGLLMYLRDVEIALVDLD